MFAALVAKLNAAIGCTTSAFRETIVAADAWMSLYPSEPAWPPADPLAVADGRSRSFLPDQYNNGLLCVPHRD
jgi:hypothetical protein